MKDGLPPLNALVAFEAAARLGSITRAARELCVTQAAVSQQVRRLEGHLGLALFARGGQGLRLTDEGRRYLDGIAGPLASIRRATDALMAEDTSGVLTVIAAPSFANRWIVPRFNRFYERHPDIDLRIGPAPVAPELGRGVDIIIYHDIGDRPGTYSMPLMGERIFPVCSPELLDANGGEAASFLRGQLLLRHARDGMGLWEAWLEKAGLGDEGLRFGPRFDFSYLALAAALDGAGVALGRTLLVAEDLAAGRLCVPVPLTMVAPRPYWFCCAEAHAERPRVAAFREWLVDEMRRDADVDAWLQSREAAYIAGRGGVACLGAGGLSPARGSF